MKRIYRFSCVLVALASVWTPMVRAAQFNIALHTNADTAEAMDSPLQQGKLVNTDESAWLNLVRGGGGSWSFSDVNLVNPDGTESSAVMAGRVAHATAGMEWQDENKDFAMMEGAFALRGSDFIEIDNLPESWQDDFSVRIFGGVNWNPMLIGINGVTNSIQPIRPFRGVFIEDHNQLTFTGMTGTSFRVTGNPTMEGHRTHHSTITGMQIFKGLPPVAPHRFSGSESPNVHSPGCAIEVQVDFLLPVALSQEGGARLRLDFDGHQVDAVHAGDTEGSKLLFVAQAPAVTTMNGKVLADSLKLDDGVTLKDQQQNDVILTHRENPLPNDQISTQSLSVYPPVPGLEPSSHFRFRVRELGSDEWLTPFAFMTKCGEGGGYYAGGMRGWTHTYCNFEMANNVPLEVEITRLNPITGEPVDIRSAVTHPRHKARSWRVENGKAYVIFENPGQLTVDIDGQMDDNPVPRNPPRGMMTGEVGIHTVSIFANPFILDKPDLDDPTVLAIEPGTIPPQEGDWETLYFKPGIHQVWEGTWTADDVLYLKDGKNYYIPGDAVLHATLRAMPPRGESITTRVFGHGTLSQERIPHALHQTPRLQHRGLTSAMRIGGAVGTRIEGITITDSPDHSVWLRGSFNADPETWNYVRWVKVFTWRSNGDGITVDDNDFIEDSFIRVQDDGTYLKGRGVRRMVYWTDSNGTSLKINMISRMNPDNYLKQNFYVEDIDILYGRSFWPGSPGHNVFGGRADFGLRRGVDLELNDSSHIVFRNIKFWDPVPLRKAFGYSTGRGGPKDHAGVRFENIRAVENSLYGYRAGMGGIPNGQLRDFVLDNVVLSGRQVKSTDDIETNEHVINMMFENTESAVRRFHNHSGYNKWYMRKDWCGEVEPADHDRVKHTDHAGTLIVDSSAWAGSLDVAHADIAAIKLEYSGRLAVSDTLTLGDAQGARGVLFLADGQVVLRKDADDALVLRNGRIRIQEDGLLLWAGNRVEAMKTLFESGNMSLGKGRTTIPEMRPYDHIWHLIHHTDTPIRPAVPVLLGQVQGSALYADYDNINPGYTTVWVRDMPTDS